MNNDVYTDLHVFFLSFVFYFFSRQPNYRAAMLMYILTYVPICTVFYHSFSTSFLDNQITKPLC